MFNYDKVMKKLDKFDDLSKKKKEKLFDEIFLSNDFRNWFYGFGDPSENPPMTKPMVEKLFSILANPKYIRKVTKYINNKTYEEFDHTAGSIAFLIIDQAVDSLNKANKEIGVDYKAGEINSKFAKEFKEKSETYSTYVSDLMEALKDKARNEVKSICKKSGLPRALVFTTYFQIPAKKYIQKFKTTMYVNQFLRDIYRWVGSNGIEDVSSIRWGSYFGSLFGGDLVASVALAIMLEGVRRIDDYRDYDHFDDVREVWDSLTNFAITELDNAPENVRRQMLDIYVKRISRLFNNGNGPRLRVDLLNLPSTFHNLTGTISQYADRIAAITRSKNDRVSDIRLNKNDKIFAMSKDIKDYDSSEEIDNDSDDEDEE